MCIMFFFKVIFVFIECFEEFVDVVIDCGLLVEELVVWELGIDVLVSDDDDMVVYIV